MTQSEQREIKSVFFFLNLFCCLDFSKKAFFFLKNRVEKCMYSEVSIILAVDLFINCVRKMDICRHHDFTHCSVSIFAITLFFFQPLPSGVATEDHLPPCFSSINRIYGLLIFPSLVSVTLSSYMSCSTLTHFTYTYLKVDVTSMKLI